MVSPWMSRTQLMLGDEKLLKLTQKKVLVVGLGGVGGIAAEMLCRAGVGHLTLVDGDVVEASNRNRQIPALSSTEGKPKTDVLAQRLRDINPDVELVLVNQHVEWRKMGDVLASNTFDYVLDCIDTLSPKVALIMECLDRRIPFVSSMGAGGRVDPTQVRVAYLYESYNCTLARYVRKRLRQKGIYRKIKVVFSPEEIDHNRVVMADAGNPKKSIIGTISYMPAVFGCTVASVAIRELCGMPVEIPRQESGTVSGF